ncbi:urease accessory protein [Serratia fonticola]|jgi:urease accessory protein|uniref:Urease accessory protein UreD n=1 Tax=Serratia fonticola TaxID=47917 RepID=A0A542D772_SERFO|nr:urease accessory protein UreD [Serratia fonticola]TQI79052.1 urease accessory protein [Serratia fonticola]TQI98926.1 urease accessory protein [Serratia fonticola]TVZ68451.1 urease accessory protein [Serratia fonticola]
MTSVSEAGVRVNQLGDSAPELMFYQDEPPQMASGSTGKSGYLRLGFALRGQRSVLAQMERRVPFLVQRALYWDEMLPQMPCVFVISTSGCVLQGDRLAMDIHVAPQASGHVTTQSATKIHAMENNYAAQIQTLNIEQEGYLEVMPDPVIPHSGSRFITDTRITLHPTATLLFSEILMSGRKYHQADGGFNFDVYSSRISACYPDGKPLFTERYVLEPRKQPLSSVGVMGPFDVFGNVILLTPVTHHARILARISPCYDAVAGIASGVSRLPNDCGLIFKALGKESHQVKAAIRGFWRIAREEILGVTLPEPFIWR